MKEELIRRRLTRVQTKYELVRKNIGQQNSYNLDLNTEKALSDANAIKPLSENSNEYILNDDYRIELGDGIIKLIGDNFLEKKKSIRFSHTESNGGTTKFQIKRTENASGEFEWFKVLYDKNVEQSVFILSLDQENKILYFDNVLPQEEYVCELEENDNNLKEEYIKWLENQGYTGQSPRKYASSLSTLNIKIPEIDSNINFFNYNVEEYDKLIKTIISSSKYNEVNLSQNYTLSTALDNFKKFIEQLSVSCKVDKKLNYKTGIKKGFPFNRIVFGAPGTGKSYQLNKDKDDLLNICSNNYERVTFHPDYSYANFVGTYKPVTIQNSSSISKAKRRVFNILKDKKLTAQEKYDKLYDDFKDENLTSLPILLGIYSDDSFITRKKDGSPTSTDNAVERNHGKAIRPYLNINDLVESTSISYKYVPGPFMRVLVKALKSGMSSNPEPFVLIIEEINRANVAAVFGDIFQLLDRKNGFSEYPIQTSEDMRQYIADELGGNPSDYSEIRIPDNMYIWATMNSADQGVFPMDTAFKRRWNFTYLGIDDNEENIVDKDISLNGVTYTWNIIRHAINDRLSSLKINEDKLLGPFFINMNDISDENDFNETFKNKVLMYLFEDAGKQRRSKIFKPNLNVYSQVCREYDKNKLEVFESDVLNIIDDYKNKMNNGE